MLVTENDERDFPPRQVLLISNVLVGAYQHFVSGIFGLLNQITVAQFVPTDLPRIRDFVPGKTPGNRLRSAISNRIFIA